MHIGVCAAPGSPGAAHIVWTPGESGYLISMTDDRIGRRAADLLPEERAAGSADPDAQAAAILAESDQREDDPDAAPDSFLERRRSDQTVLSGAEAPREPAGERTP